MKRGEHRPTPDPPPVTSSRIGDDTEACDGSSVASGDGYCSAIVPQGSIAVGARSKRAVSRFRRLGVNLAGVDHGVRRMQGVRRMGEYQDGTENEAASVAAQLHYREGKDDRDCSAHCDRNVSSLFSGASLVQILTRSANSDNGDAADDEVGSIGGSHSENIDDRGSSEIALSANNCDGGDGSGGGFLSPEYPVLGSCKAAAISALSGLLQSAVAAGEVAAKAAATAVAVPSRLASLAGQYGSPQASVLLSEESPHELGRRLSEQEQKAHQEHSEQKQPSDSDGWSPLSNSCPFHGLSRLNREYPSAPHFPSSPIQSERMRNLRRSPGDSTNIGSFRCRPVRRHRYFSARNCLQASPYGHGRIHRRPQQSPQQVQLLRRCSSCNNISSVAYVCPLCVALSLRFACSCHEQQNPRTNKNEGADHSAFVSPTYSGPPSRDGTPLVPHCDILNASLLRKQPFEEQLPGRLFEQCKAATSSVGGTPCAAPSPSPPSEGSCYIPVQPVEREVGQRQSSFSLSLLTRPFSIRRHHNDKGPGESANSSMASRAYSAAAAAAAAAASAATAPLNLRRSRGSNNKDTEEDLSTAHLPEYDEYLAMHVHKWREHSFDHVEVQDVFSDRVTVRCAIM